MEFLDGSSIELKITDKARICKLLPIFSKQNLEKMSKDFIKLKPTEVLDTDGVSELEVNTPKPQVVVEAQSVSKEKRNDVIRKYY